MIREIKTETRTWGRSKANHRYKDLLSGRGTSCTKEDILQYVENGMAEDVSKYSDKEIKDLLHSINKEVLGKSRSGYGYNAVLFRDKNTGDLYAITDRNSNLFSLL